MALVVVVLLAACGDGGGAERTYSPDELEPVLVVADEIGQGWTEEMRDVFTTRGEGPPAMEASAVCPAASGQADELEALAADSGAAVEVNQERTGRRDFHGVSEQLWSSDDATDYVVAVRTAFEACVGTTWTVEDEGGAGDQQVTLRALDAPDVGDMSTAAVAEVATPGPDGTYIWRSRIVVGRFGTAVMTITELDVQLEGTEPHFTETEWTTVVETAAAKVERLTAH
jgi:hypothetical protein